MKIGRATRKYEEWLGRRLRIVEPDLRLKHEKMKADAFQFFRATFYRWIQVWPEACPALQKCPRVLAVGDLHLENFGTWRDAEGRLAWGVNDFDETCVLPWTNDLVRLATSACVAIDLEHLALGKKAACEAILEGYRDSLEEGGRPVVLGEHHHWLREIATSSLRDPAPYWKKLSSLPGFKGKIPKGARKALESLLPDRELEVRISHRVAGLGSLGRERFVAVADWHGGKIAREAKALAPSVAVWADAAKSEKIHYEEILASSIRCRDPFVRLRGRWIARRLAPDCSRIELSDLPRKRDESRLLREMGRETANVHLGTPGAREKILRDLSQRPARWLHDASAAMVSVLFGDWKDWRSL